MNEIVETEKPKLAPKAPLQAGAKAAGIVPTSIEEVARIARVAIESGLQVGTNKDSVDAKLAKAMMIVMQGLELSVAPVQALNGIAIINGRPSPWGKFARALVLRAGHKIDEWTTGTPYDDDFTHHCKVTRGDNGQVTERNFSVDDAKAAGLWQTEATVEKKDWDNKSNPNAKKSVPNDSPWWCYKKDMLAARAFSRASIGVADALLGMEIAEVLRDVEDHRTQPAEDRGPVFSAPPPPLAAEARKPLEPEPDPIERTPEPDAPAPIEEKVPEPEPVDMDTAIARFIRHIGTRTTGTDIEQALADFERNMMDTSRSPKRLSS